MAENAERPTVDGVLSDLFPHGRCECDGPTCCSGRGPAAYEVTRDGTRMRVCTRCDLSSDADKVLLVTREDSVKVFLDFDPLGLMCLALDLAKDAPPTVGRAESVEPACDPQGEAGPRS